MNKKGFYGGLSFYKKRSFNKSMNDAINDFLENKYEILSEYNTYELLISDIYFHWIRFSAEFKYKWCSDNSDFLLQNDFFEETKVTLYVCFCKNKLDYEKKHKKKESSY